MTLQVALQQRCWGYYYTCNMTFQGPRETPLAQLERDTTVALARVAGQDQVIVSHLIIGKEQ